MDGGSVLQYMCALGEKTIRLALIGGVFWWEGEGEEFFATHKNSLITNRGEARECFACTWHKINLTGNFYPQSSPPSLYSIE